MGLQSGRRSTAGRWRLKLEMVTSYLEGKAKVFELSRAYGVFPTTIYGWQKTFRKHGEGGLAEGSRRNSPRKEAVRFFERAIV
jgi:transposase-like protein